jgi:urocanate hydratase
MGIFRQADAGSDIALNVAKEKGVKIPAMEG